MRLEQYIKESLKKGTRLSQIKKDLAKAGHSSADIEDALHNLHKEHIIELARYISRKMKHGMKPSAVKNYLLSLGHPQSNIDEALEKVLRAKRYLLTKKKIEKTEAQFKEIKKNMISNISKPLKRLGIIISPLKTWQKFAYIPAIIAMFVILVWIFIMMTNSIFLSGSLNCYSFGRVVTCSFIESMIYYLLVFLALSAMICLPVFGLGALVGYLIERFRG